MIGTFLAVLAALAVWSDWQKQAEAKATLRNAERVNSIFYPKQRQMQRQKSGRIRPGFWCLGVLIAGWIAILYVLVA